MSYSYKYKVGDKMKVIQWMRPAPPLDEIVTIKEALPVFDIDKVVSGYLILREGHADIHANRYYIVESWLEPVAAEQQKCTCDIAMLMTTGCRCGWIKKERELGISN